MTRRPFNYHSLLRTNSISSEICKKLKESLKSQRRRRGKNRRLRRLSHLHRATVKCPSNIKFKSLQLILSPLHRRHRVIKGRGKGLNLAFQLYRLLPNNDMMSFASFEGFKGKQKKSKSKLTEEILQKQRNLPKAKKDENGKKKKRIVEFAEQKFSSSSHEKTIRITQSCFNSSNRIVINQNLN